MRANYVSRTSAPLSQRQTIQAYILLQVLLRLSSPDLLPRQTRPKEAHDVGQLGSRLLHDDAVCSAKLQVHAAQVLAPDGRGDGNCVRGILLPVHVDLWSDSQLHSVGICA